MKRLQRHARYSSARHLSVSVQHALGMILSGVATFVLTTVCWLTIGVVAPNFAGWKTFSVSTGSMQPRLNPGDIVIVQPGADNLAPGKLVSFRDPAKNGRITTHRLVRYNEADKMWVTKGDANINADSTPVPSAQIMGVAKAVIPYAGYPAMWQTRKNYAPLMGLIALIVLSCALYPLSRKLERKGTIELHRVVPEWDEDDDDVVDCDGLEQPLSSKPHRQQAGSLVAEIPQQQSWVRRKTTPFIGSARF